MKNFIKNNNTIKGILFDFDGVILDTEPLWFKAAINTLKYLKIPYNNKINYKDQIGVHANKVFKELAINKITKIQEKQIKIILEKQIDKIFSKKINVSPFLKKFLKQTNLPYAIVSNSPKKHIIKLLKKENMYKYFNIDMIISCHGKLRPKPFPDGFIYGLSTLNISAKNTLVIEDSDNGIQSAKKAGIKNILRYTNKDNNLPKKIKYKNIKKIKSFKELIT